MLKFWYNLAPNPMKVALMLEELGVPYEPIPVDTRKGEQHTDAFKAVNPNAKVPAIDDDGVLLFDSNAILLYLADKTGQLHDFNLRYLSPYIEQVRPQAKSLGLDEAWVYGLMRQESRFITSAKSVVGASGLMQLMPATAAWVAKRTGMLDFRPSLVNDVQVNLGLGTAYLRTVLNDLDDHPVLASAAYNAGPGRARAWRTVQPLDAAIYAESIPFGETRDYVKRVMSNATYYAQQFGHQATSLRARIGTIPARN
jgi:soluble lytic murein transglycosylase